MQLAAGIPLVSGDCICRQVVNNSGASASTWCGRVNSRMSRISWHQRCCAWPCRLSATIDPSTVPWSAMLRSIGHSRGRRWNVTVAGVFCMTAIGVGGTRAGAIGVKDAMTGRGRGTSIAGVRSAGFATATDAASNDAVAGGARAVGSTAGTAGADFCCAALTRSAPPRPYVGCGRAGPLAMIVAVPFLPSSRVQAMREPSCRMRRHDVSPSSHLKNFWQRRPSATHHRPRSEDAPR